MFIIPVILMVTSMLGVGLYLMLSNSGLGGPDLKKAEPPKE